MKRGDALPFLPMLGALGSLSAASVTKAVTDSKAARRQLEELQRHECAMEQGRGLYLAPYKYRRGLYLSPYKHRQNVATKKKYVKKTIKISSGATTNVQLNELARYMRESYFRGVFIRNMLPTSGAH